MLKSVRFQPKLPAIHVSEIKTASDLQDAMRELEKACYPPMFIRERKQIVRTSDNSVILALGEHLLISDNGFVFPSRDTLVGDGDFRNTHPSLFLPCDSEPNHPELYQGDFG